MSLMSSKSLNNGDSATKAAGSFVANNIAIQKKLAIGAVNDPLEHEADAMADKVMRMPISTTSSNTAGAIQRKCNHCEEEEKVQRKPLAPFIQKVGVQAGNTASDAVSANISATRGNGNSMDGSTKSFMESRFGADFGSVRIHTGSDSIQMNRELNANAFTIGSDIYFNEGKYEPGSSSGKHLLAHELTHTVQQGGSQGIQQKMIQRDLAVEPTVANPTPRVLTNAQVAVAIRWNQVVFTDPEEIALIRDIVGVPEQPAVIDEGFIQMLVQYQADYGLTQDGKVGAGTALRLANELRAEGNALGAAADVGTATETALNPGERRMRLRSRVVARLGQVQHQGFIGPRDNPTGIVTARTGFTNPGRTDLTNAIGINYTGSNADNSRWLQFAFRQMSTIDPATRRRIYRPGFTTTSAGTGRPYSDGTTFRWAVDTVPATGSMYYDAGFTAERNPGGHTEIFDQPNGWNNQAETYAASFATRPANVRFINGFDTYLVVNDNRVVYHVRWNIYFNFNTSTSPTPDVAGTYEVLSAGAASRLPADRKAALDAAFPTNTVP